jgi:hypothetical protein
LIIDSAVEGIVDEALARRLVSIAGADVGTVYGRSGKQNLLDRVVGFNEAARRSPWLVLVDLDNDFDCGPEALEVWLPRPTEWMCFRIAVREAEAWLMADSEALASYLSIARSVIPREPEALVDPKQTMVNLARRSRRRDIREEMVPRASSGRSVGPGYPGRVIDYIASAWRPEIAATSAPSLGKCIAALTELSERPWP